MGTPFTSALATIFAVLVRDGEDEQSETREERDAGLAIRYPEAFEGSEDDRAF